MPAHLCMMRYKVALLLLFVSGVSSGEEPPAPRGEYRVRIAASDIYRTLIKAGSSWTLPLATNDHEGAPEKVVIKVKDVKKIEGAAVAQLEWSCVQSGTAETCSLYQMPQEVAITAKGMYVFNDVVEDRVITKALKKAPPFKDPPKMARAYTRKDGFFSFEPKDRAGTLCIGMGADKPDPDDVGCGSSPCFQWMCLDTSGIVGAGGLGEGYDYGFKPTTIPGGDDG